MTTLGSFGFAIEMEISTNGEFFEICGDHQKLIVCFTSIRAALHFSRSRSLQRLTTTQPVRHLLNQMEVETQISGREIARTGREIRPDVLSGFLGLKSTRLNFANLVRALISPSHRAQKQNRS